jgi:hypothetical protein
MPLLAKMPVNVVISNACVAKIKLWNLEKIKPLNRISLFIIFRVFINFCMIRSYICIISIHIIGMGSDKQPGKSLMYIKNNSGPRIEPCGTPHDIIWLLERTPLT